jgi:hypothetical protein
MPWRSAWAHKRCGAPELPPIDELIVESHPAYFSRAPSRETASRCRQTPEHDMLNHRPMRDAKASSRRCQVGTPSLSTHEASIGRDLDWPLRAAEARALDTSLTLGDCISSSLQECLSHVPAHGFEIFRATHARPTVQSAGLNLRVRVRACPSASDVRTAPGCMPPSRTTTMARRAWCCGERARLFQA